MSKPIAVLLVVLAFSCSLFAGHRESPLTNFDPAANISDVFAFRSYNPGSFAVTLIMCVDPLQEPAVTMAGHPFDPDIMYELKVDNNNDALPDIIFQFRFTTELRLPNVYEAYLGVPGGSVAPANSPPPVPAGTQIVPPRITSFSDAGLGIRQSYTVTMIKGGIATVLTNGTGNPFYAVPPNAGPRTMDYNALFNAAIHTTTLNSIKVFAGNVDDPSYFDAGGFNDTLNASKAPPILSPAEDVAFFNLASDTYSGFAVNAIAIEVPISMLTSTGAIEAPNSPAATIGVWATTSRPRSTVRRSPLPPVSTGAFLQTHRMGNPYTNDILIGTGYKDRFALDLPANDSQFASFFLDPSFARIVNALTSGAIAIPTPPRLDLLPLFTYAPPIAAPGTTSGPVSDMLRLNTGVAPTPEGSPFFSRLGLLGGDPAGFPNGRRLQDDDFDIMGRLLLGVLAGPPFNTSPINTKFGDAVNVNDAPFRSTFPFLANAPSGRSRRHIDPGEPGCTAGAGAPCLP